MEKRFKEIFARKTEIRSLLQSGEQVDIAALEKELKDLNTEETELRHRQEIADGINLGEIPAATVLPNAKEPDARSADPYDTVEYRSAFMAYVTKGTPVPAEMRSDATSTTADNGAVIPKTILNKIIDKLTASGMILPLVTQTSYKGGLSIPTSTVKPVATWVAESATSDKQKKTTGSVTFNYYKLRCAVAVSLEMDNIALAAFENALINNVSEAMVIALEKAIISGTGTGQPKGILTETAPEGQALTMVTADYKTLSAIETAIPLEYETGGVYVMTKKTFGEFLGMVDSNKQPIARVNYNINGAPERALLGRKVILCNYLPSFSAASVGDTVAFVFRFEDYVLNTNYAMTVKKYEDYTTDDQVTKAILLADGKVVDTGSLVTIKKASA